MKTEIIPYNQCVFIGYHDAAMTDERMRAYPHDEESYYECMDQMMEHCDFWQCLDKREVDKILSPYEKFQLERYGNIIPPVTAIPVDDCFESGMEELNRLANWIDTKAQLQTDDYLGY